MTLRTMFLVALLAILVLVVGNMHEPICPLSSVMDLNGTFNYFYPLDIYDQNRFAKATERNETYHCDADDFKGRKAHYCSSKMERFCPITLQNVRDATVHKYHRSSSLCHLKAKLANPKESVNVFAFGGSVTAGSGADNCHRDYPEGPSHVVNHRCAWPYHFGEWLKNISAANVTMYNMAMSSQDSYTRSVEFPEDLKVLHNITQFTENDLIFLDHSVNDHVLLMPQIEKGIEHLIRKIYSMSKPHSWPSIVVLDTYAIDFRYPKQWLFPIAYEKIVRHYNLSMWSYREAVHSNYSITHQRNYSEYIRWRQNVDADIHPPWHVHIFMADLFSAIFQSELNHCSDHHVQMATRLHQSQLTNIAPLSLSSVDNECSDATTPLLSMSYFEYMHKVPFIGNVTMHPEGSWKMREDRPGKGGFITELVDGLYPLPNQINASIEFKLSESTKYLMASNKTNLRLQLMYLKTYENAGLVKAFLCGLELDRIDALWTDNHISVPVYYTGGLDATHCKDYEYPTVTVTHIESGGKYRGNQKFKIIGVKSRQGFFIFENSSRVIWWMTLGTMFLVAFLATFALVVGNMHEPICPLSSVMDLNGTFNYFYPLDIYDQDRFIKATKRNETYHCDADDINWRVAHYCSSKMERFCPITLQNVRDATVHKYHRSSSLCHLKAKLADQKESVNVFTFGGSVTAGSGADNCYRDYPQVPGHVVNQRCAWPYHFGEWLKNISAANVTMYNMAMSSQDSYTRSVEFPRDLKVLHNITQFTVNDLIFLDHSVNDHVLLMPQIEKGIEHLIRKIYSMSKPNSWPSIVVLDTYAYEFRYPKQWLFPIAYEKIVRHYNLSMWSYREAVHSNYSITHQRNYSEYIRWRRNMSTDIHPPWHIHIIMADLFSAIFQTELNHCSDHHVQMATRLHRSQLANIAPLSLSSVDNECSDATTPLLSMSYFEYTHKVLFIGNVTMHPEGSWKMREDRPGKGGFITELVDGSYPLPNQTNASIEFRLSESTKSLIDSNKKDLRLQLMYLKTYENAGSVKVFLCGHKLDKLDALWTDNHISVPEYFITGLDLNHCKDHEYPTVTVAHIESKGKNRGNQKFKIIGVKVCIVDYQGLSAV